MVSQLFRATPKIVLLVLSAVGFIGPIVWFVRKPDFEPLLVTVGAISGIISLTLKTIKPVWVVILGVAALLFFCGGIFLILPLTWAIVVNIIVVSCALAVVFGLSSRSHTEVDNLLCQGYVSLRKGQCQEALLGFEKALTIAREMNDRVREGEALNNIGLVYQCQGKYPEALNNHQQALVIARKMNDRVREGEALNNIGLVYQRQGKYPEALNNHQQALVIAREMNDRIGVGKTLNNIGEVYQRKSEYQEALDNHQQALVIAREVGDRAGVGKTLNNIGEVYQRKSEYQEALGNYQQALVIGRVASRKGTGCRKENRNNRC